MTLLEVFMESKEVKKLIVQRSIFYEIPLHYLCKEVGIEYEKFMSTYINSGSWDSCDISENQFTRILSILGIEVRYQFVIERQDLKEISRALSAKYQERVDKNRIIKEKRDDKKERDIA